MGTEHSAHSGLQFLKFMCLLSNRPRKRKKSSGTSSILGSIIFALDEYLERLRGQMFPAGPAHFESSGSV